MKTIQVIIERENETNLSQTSNLYSGFVGLLKNLGFINHFKNENFISLEIIKNNDVINFYITSNDLLIKGVSDSLYAVYPKVSVTSCIDPLSSIGLTSVSKLKFSKPNYFPIKNSEDMFEHFLHHIINSLTNNSGVQVVINNVSNRFYLSVSRFISSVAESNKQGEKQVWPAELISSVQDKINENCFNVTIRAFGENIKAIENTFSQLQNRSVDIEFKDEKLSNLVSRNYSNLFGFKSGILNSKELSILWHLPNSLKFSENIKFLNVNSVSLPENLPTEGIQLGNASFRGKESKVKIKDTDRRRHTYIVGQTGTGKSELLKYMAYQDIVNGKGVAFIDPHGNAVEDLLKIIPDDRVKDVIYFNPADREKPIGINILDVKTEDQKHIVINSFIALLYKLYDPDKKGIIGPRLERTVRNVMLTSMSSKDSTLIEVLRLITDYKYANSRIEKITDPLVKKYWTDEIKSTTDFHKSEVLGYFSSKFDRFVTEKTIRNIVGQRKTTLDFDEIVNSKKILLINLSKGQLGEENSVFLGYLIISKILVTAMNRTGKTNFDDFYLYVDEFQNFSTPDFVTIFSEARKYKLNLIVANQFIKQLSEDIKNAVFGNVGSILSFRVGSEDSTYLHTHFKDSFNQSDLVNAGVGEIFTKLLIDGKPSKPFLTHSPWHLINNLNAHASEKTAEKIKKMSALKYGRDKDYIDLEIAKRLNLDE
ncbi:MAG: type IV secretion system DNA-binding domain-containing protein [bacterium]|nr:type IV secretion system DNA-binding domain-containing protein [bacterium]